MSQRQPVRRYVPAHMKAPFLTQPEKKRRPSSSNRVHDSNQRTSRTHRSISQQRRQSSSLMSKSIIEHSQPRAPIPSILTMQNESNDNHDIDHDIIPLDQTSDMMSIDETNTLDRMPIPNPIVLNRTLIKPLRRLRKQNQNLRLQLENELNKKRLTLSSPFFIDRLNELVKSLRLTHFL